MLRSERQEQIYQDIQAVETELTGCPHGSPRWYELHDRLHALLAEYTAVPQDPPPRADSSPRSFRQASHELRGLIWLIAVTLLLALPMALELGQDLPWMPPLWCVAAGTGLAWAVWASSPQKR